MDGLRPRAPAPGSVAALVNRAHTLTDLICTVDAFEDRLLDAIDRTRTLAGIMRPLAGDEAAARRALCFFERLWQYDQIVFDASSAQTRLDHGRSSARHRRLGRVVPTPNENA